MSELLIKSKQNLDAADYLLKNKIRGEHLFAPIVHCSYYSCLQKMMFILIYEYNISSTKVDLKVREANGGTHNYVINTIYQDLYNNNYDEITLVREFKTLVSTLKEKRVIADYDDTKIGEKIAVASLRDSKKAQEILQNFFKILEDYESEN